MKVRSFSFCIVFIIIAILKSVGVSNVDESNVDNYVASDCVSVANFIENNFGKFTAEYNAATDNSWQANYIEKRYPITIDECGNIYDGVFLDFDNDNGYAVVGYDYMLLDFTTFGESPYLNIDTSEYYYSTATGYFYLSGDEYLSVNPNNNTDEQFFIRTTIQDIIKDKNLTQKAAAKLKIPTLMLRINMVLVGFYLITQVCQCAVIRNGICLVIESILYKQTL